jgi:hypothetical protein
MVTRPTQTRTAAGTRTVHVAPWSDWRLWGLVSVVALLAASADLTRSLRSGNAWFLVTTIASYPAALVLVWVTYRTWHRSRRG